MFPREDDKLTVVEAAICLLRFFLFASVVLILLTLLMFLFAYVADAAEPNWWRMCITEKGCLLGTLDGAYTWYFADGVGYTIEQYGQFREVSGDWVWAWGVIGP